MTPTLRGRVHTRLFLSAVLGVPITLPFCLLAFPFLPIPLVLLAIVVATGLCLDPVYQLMQQRRWDHDWPVWAQILAGAVEGVIAFIISAVVLILASVVLTPLALVSLLLFPIHYGLVWLAMFAFGLGPMRVLFPHWRYRGGELGRGRRWQGSAGS